eukprot:5878176-Pleurochrysis_carterae.AAC.2
MRRSWESRRSCLSALTRKGASFSGTGHRASTPWRSRTANLRLWTRTTLSSKTSFESEAEDDDEDGRPPLKAPKSKTKQSNIRLALQRRTVRWTAVSDEADFRAQAGSDYEEYVDRPRAPKADHAGASTSSMLSPIREI